MGIIDFVTRHWNQGSISDDWTPGTKLYKKLEDGTYAVQSNDFKSTTAIYVATKHKQTGEIFPEDSNFNFLKKDITYILLTPALTALTVFGNSARFLIDFSSGLQAKIDGQPDAFRLAKEDAKLICKKVALLAPFVAWSYFGHSATALAAGLLGAACLYSAYNPRGAAVAIANFEDNFNSSPITETALGKATWEEKAKQFAIGAYPLNRILGIHRLGSTLGDRNNYEVVVEIKKQN